MKFRPLHDRVVVKRIEAEEKTAGGIIIPDTAKEKPSQGEVVSVGPGGRDGLDRVHRLGLHPLHYPVSRVRRRWFARLIDHSTVAAVVADVRRRAAGVPIEKEARPAMMMHRFGLSGRRHRHFQHADE